MTKSVDSVHAYGWRFATPVLIGPALNPINTTMITVAVVPISKAVGVNTATAIWLIASLYLASSIALPAMGTIADRYGPKKVYLAGLAVVILAGLIPTLWPSFIGVVFARVLIGIGTSAAYPSALTFIKDESIRCAHKAPQWLMSALSISSLVSATIGPVIGGFLIGSFNWQSIFLVNIPIAAVAFLTALLWLPGDKTRTVPKVTAKLDLLGMAFFGIATASALVVLLDLQSAQYWLLGLSVIMFATLILWEFRAGRPFIDVRMLARNGALTRTYLRLFLVYAASYLVVYAVTQWLQDSVGIGSGEAGSLQLPAVIAAGALSLLMARTTVVRLPLIVSALAPMTGGVLLLFVFGNSPVWWIATVVAIFGIPQGLASIANQSVLYRVTPASDIGVSAGLSRTAVQFGAIASSAVLGIVFTNGTSDGGIHLIAWVVMLLGAVAFVLTLFDRSLHDVQDDAVTADPIR